MGTYGYAAPEYVMTGECPSLVLSFWNIQCFVDLFLYWTFVKGQRWVMLLKRSNQFRILKTWRALLTTSRQCKPSVWKTGRVGLRGLDQEKDNHNPCLGHCLVLMDLNEETGLDQERGSHNLCLGQCQVLMVRRLTDLRFLLRSLKEQLHSFLLRVDIGHNEERLQCSKLYRLFKRQEIYF